MFTAYPILTVEPQNDPDDIHENQNVFLYCDIKPTVMPHYPLTWYQEVSNTKVSPLLFLKKIFKFFEWIDISIINIEIWFSCKFYWHLTNIDYRFQKSISISKFIIGIVLKIWKIRFILILKLILFVHRLSISNRLSILKFHIDIIFYLSKLPENTTLMITSTQDFNNIRELSTLNIHCRCSTSFATDDNIDNWRKIDMTIKMKHLIMVDIRITKIKIDLDIRLYN